MELIQLVLCSSMILSGIFVSFLENPIESVLFLILTFCLGAINLLIWNVEFLGLLFIIIYVGAIAVLFLFVIMMLNIKTVKKNFIFLFKRLFLVILIISILNYFGNYFFSNIFNLKILSFYENTLIFKIDSITNIESLGQILYNYFLICVLIAGLILLVALLGAIILTYKFTNLQKAQNISKQLSRNSHSISFFK